MSQPRPCPDLAVNRTGMEREHHQTDHLIFEVLIRGQRHVLREIARVLKAAVADWEGGGKPVW